MDYEQKYNDALGWMRSVYPTMTGAVKEDAEHFFPELKESDDERIKKTLMGFLQTIINDKQCKLLITDIHGDDISDMLPEWFEWVAMHGATKPAEWSDEDEKMLKKCIGYASYHMPIPDKTKFVRFEQKDDDEAIAWLKALKDRVQPQNHWKPSKDQMTALRRMKAAVAGEGVVNNGLNSLYDDLVKLVGTGQ